VIDALAAIDDMLTERYRACLVCGKRSHWMDIREVGNTARFACLCQPCYRAHGWAAVDHLLAQRARQGDGGS
jgi:hypothetical protein